MNSALKVIAISGSLRSNSSCNLVLHDLNRVSGASYQIELYDGIRHLPLFDDTEPTSAVLQFKEKIKMASGVIICQPEYAFGVAGALKNALDWTVGTGEFSRKPMALITAATGGINAHEAMLKTLTALDCILGPHTDLLISGIKSKIDSSGRLKDEKVIDQIVSLLEHFEPVVRNACSITY